MIDSVGDRTSLTQAWMPMAEQCSEGSPPATSLEVATLVHAGQLVKIDDRRINF